MAGGWVRDKLLGQESDDIDITVDNMTGQNFANMISSFVKNERGANVKIGIIKANPQKSKHLETATFKLQGIDIDVSNLRKEVYDGKTRIPTMIQSTAEQDAYRRDFTFNAMYYNIMEGKLEDFTGKGLIDLHNKIVRTPLDPQQTFSDDPLRILRAARFAAKLDFKLDPSIHNAASSSEIRPLLKSKVSRERFGQELIKTLYEYSPTAGATMISLLCKWGIVDIIFAAPTNVALNIPDPITITRSVIVLKTLLPLPIHDKQSDIRVPAEEASSWTHAALLKGQASLEQARLFLEENTREPRTRANLLLSSFLIELGLSTCTIAKKQHYLQSFILSKSIQRPQNYKDCQIISIARLSFSHLCIRLTTLDRKQTENKISTRTSLENIIVEAGWTVLFANKLTPIVLDALIIQARVAEASPTIDQVDTFIEWMEKMKLMTWYDRSFLLNGRDIIEHFGVTGKLVGIIKNSVHEWELLHPEGTKQEAIRWVNQHLKYRQ